MPLSDHSSPVRAACLLPVKGVKVFFGNVSKMWIERRLEDDPAFPRPCYISGKRYWRGEAVAAWVKGQPLQAPDWVVDAGPRGKIAAERGRVAMAARRAAANAEPAPPPMKPTGRKPRPAHSPKVAAE